MNKLTNQLGKKLSVVVVCITPFDEDGSLHENYFRRQLRRLGEAGVSVYVGGSGSGEGYTLSQSELERALKISVEELKGKVQVRAMGGEPRTAQEMISLVQIAEKCGMDAAQIFSIEIGHGIHPSFEEMKIYYSSVIESTAIPIYLSSHPQASGYFIPIDLVDYLIDRYPQIVGIAYGGYDTPYLAELIRRVGGKIEVHCAGPTNGLNVLCLGGNGFMGAEGNFSPVMVQNVIDAFAAQDLAKLRQSFDLLMAFETLFIRYGGHTMRGLKPLMNAFGLPGGSLRLPRVGLPPEQVKAFVEAVQKLDLPGIGNPV